MPSLKQWLALDKAGNLFKIIRHNNGVFGSLYRLFRMDTLKFGKLVGVDQYGNRYYQNNYYFYGRNRWVEYNDKVFLEYDATMVPAEWHNWLHYVTDDTPVENPRVNYKWMIDHTQNLSGTTKQYVPYTTTPPKIQAWSPPGTQNRLTIK